MIVEPKPNLEPTRKKGFRYYRLERYHYNDDYYTLVRADPKNNQWPISYYFKLCMPIEFQDNPEDAIEFCRYHLIHRDHRKYRQNRFWLPHEYDWSDWALTIMFEAPKSVVDQFIKERHPGSFGAHGNLIRETVITDLRTGESMQCSSAKAAQNWAWEYMLTDEERLQYNENSFKRTLEGAMTSGRTAYKRFISKYISPKKVRAMVQPERYGIQAAALAAKAEARWLDNEIKNKAAESAEKWLIGEVPIKDTDEYDELAEIF